jgi:hypothetical protein
MLSVEVASWPRLLLILSLLVAGVRVEGRQAAADSVPNGWSVFLPPRSSTAPIGDQLAVSLNALNLADREQKILHEILAGNVPESWRRFVPVPIFQSIDGKPHELIMFVSPDYVSIGSDANSLRIPLSPGAAQSLADKLNCLLPTRQLVNSIYETATLQLAPQPMAPTDEMTHVSYFAKHHRAIEQQLAEKHPGRGLGQLTAGHKKDVVLTSQPANAPGRVAIYGWHKAIDQPIQPLYTGHRNSWVDYSHGIRLIARKAFLNGSACDVGDLLADERLHVLVSDEGPVNATLFETMLTIEDSKKTDGETTTILQWTPEVRVCINESTALPEKPPEKTELLFYALPNGNTIEQTLGKKMQPGDDWHHDIQHIAAQTRFLRREQSGKNLVLILLEAKGLSWPGWRKKHGDEQIPKLFSELQSRYSSKEPSVVLSGHSGGGSLIFGFLNASAEIPAEVTRIAFLDATYAYETDRHSSKITTWLKRPGTSLCVLAYKDDEVTLNGKRIVSATGGTWYRSRLLRDDLAALFPFTETTFNEIVRVTSPDRRIQFLLHTNPENRILHTVQVEKNGLIHCMVSGTPQEEHSYQYFSERAYSEFIR